jgi:hypothetical protein
MPKKRGKAHLKSFERLYLHVSPLFHQFATVRRLLTVRKLLIMLEGTQGGGVYRSSKQDVNAPAMGESRASVTRWLDALLPAAYHALR